MVKTGLNQAVKTGLVFFMQTLCIGGVYSENHSYTPISVETVIFKVTLSKESSLKSPFHGKKMMVLLDPISKLIKRKICVTAH